MIVVADRTVKMVVVGGVRYRPEDAPEPKSDRAEVKARDVETVHNKARTSK